MAKDAHETKGQVSSEALGALHAPVLQFFPELVAELGGDPALLLAEVGVVPAARGRGLGRALVLEAARRLRSAGDEGAWLCVEIRNPAARLYRDLGFVDRGRRARFSG